jgi:hypothetical protein
MADILDTRTLILVIIGETRPLAGLAKNLLSYNMPAGYDSIHWVVANMDENDIKQTAGEIVSAKSRVAGQQYTLVVVMLVELASAGTISTRADEWGRAWPRRFLWYWRPPRAPLMTVPIPVDSVVVDAVWCERQAAGAAWEEIKRQARITRARLMWDVDGLRHLDDTSGW